PRGISGDVSRDTAGWNGAIVPRRVPPASGRVRAGVGRGQRGDRGGWYYQATMPATARLYPERRAAAFSVLTLLGALASPIFYPIAGALAEAYGWRDAVRVLVLLLLVLALPAALAVNSPPAARGGATAGLASGVREAIRR